MLCFPSSLLEPTGFLIVQWLYCCWLGKTCEHVFRNNYRMESLSTNPSDALVFHFTQSNEDACNEVGNSIEKNSDAKRTISTANIIEETESSSAEKVEIWMNGVKRVIFVPRVKKQDNSSNASVISKTVSKPKAAAAAEVGTDLSHVTGSGNTARIPVNSVGCENSAISGAAYTNSELPSNRFVATVAPQINRNLDRTLSSSAVGTAKSCLDGIHDGSSVIKRERPRSPKDCFDYRSSHDSVTSLANVSDITCERPFISEDNYRRLLHERQPSNAVPRLSDAAGLQSSSTRGFAGISGSQVAADGSLVGNGYAHFALRSAPPRTFNGHQYAVQHRYPIRQIQVHRPVPVLTTQSFSTEGESRFGYPRFIQERFPRPLDTRWGENHSIPTRMINTVIGAGTFLPQDRGVSDYSYLMSAVDHCAQPTAYRPAPPEQRPMLPVDFNQNLPPCPSYRRFTVPQLHTVPSNREPIRTRHDFGFSNRFLIPQNFTDGVSCSTNRIDLPVASAIPVFGFQHGGLMDPRHLKIPASAAGVPHSLQGLRKPLGTVGPYASENLNASRLSFSQPAVVNMGIQSRMSLLHNAYSNGMIPSTTNQEVENQRLNYSHNPVWMLKDTYQQEFSLPFAPSFLNTKLAQPGSCLSSSIENIISLSQIVQPSDVNVSTQNGVYSCPDILLRDSYLHNTAAVTASSALATVASSCMTLTLTHSQPFCSTSSTSQMSGSLQRHQSPILPDTLKALNRQCDSGDVQKQVVSNGESYAQCNFPNSLQEVRTTRVNGNFEATIVSSVLPEMPPLFSIDSMIQGLSSGDANNTESSSLAARDKTKDNDLCTSVGSNIENLLPVQNYVKTKTVSEMHFDDKCKGAFEHSVKSHVNPSEGHDALVPVEQREQQETSGSPSGSPPMQFISDVMTSMEKDDVLVDQWLDSLMDNITESSRDSAGSQSKPNKTCGNVNNVAESRVSTSVRKVSAQKKRRTWIGIKSIEAEMSSKSPDGKPKRRKRRRLTMRSNQSPEPSCDGSSDSWHPDGSESSESSNDTIVSSLPSICNDSSTSSWSSNDSVTIGRRSRKHHKKKRFGSNPRAARTRRRRRLRCRILRMRETSPWQRIHPCHGEMYECFVSLQLLCLKGLKSIDAGKVGEFLCCKSVENIFAEDSRSDRDDSLRTRKRKKGVQRNEPGISHSRIQNSSDTDDSYESWKPFKSKKRILRFQISQ